MLRIMIQDLKEHLVDKNAPFGVDLLLPKVGEGARATNSDYTGGKLNELIDVIIEEKAKLFVSAVGVPPKEVVDRLHQHGILVMNMIGSPKHVEKALEVGVDIICAQGGEGGGHTGDIGTMVLIPAVVDKVKGKKSPLTGKQILVVAAGGIYDGRTMSAALCLGASAVWVGTRFVACKEANAPKLHKDTVCKITHDQTMRTLVYTGRPMRIAFNEYARMWETERREKMEKLLKSGTVPSDYDMECRENGAFAEDDLKSVMKFADKPQSYFYPHLLGQVSGSINEVLSAKEIIDEMVSTSHYIMNKGLNFNSKL